MTRPVLILGAGPAGLGAALALGSEATLLERKNEVAGLSSTINLDGAVFDLGGHSFHTPYRHVKDLVFNAVQMEEQQRDAWCWRDGEWIAYPFQKHVADLADPTLRAACIEGMAKSSDALGAPHFDAFIDARFGKAVADAFMRPYNQKLWGHDLTRLTRDWTAERVAGPLGVRESFVEHGGARTPLQAETRIAYPAKGGFGRIFEALALRIDDLRLNADVVRIDPELQTAELRSGAKIGWEHLVSTLPLPVLLKAIPDVPEAIKAAVAMLEPIPVNLVMVVLEGRGPVDRQRVYCADPDMPGHKIVLNHTSSRWLRERPRHGIQVEASAARGEPTNLAATVVGDLTRIGLIKPGDVRSAEVIRLNYGYPAPTHARDASIRKTRAWLADRNIHICGRFAEWAYVNADDALARGLALGSALMSEPARVGAVASHA